MLHHQHDSFVLVYMSSILLVSAFVNWSSVLSWFSSPFLNLICQNAIKQCRFHPIPLVIEFVHPGKVLKFSNVFAMHQRQQIHGYLEKWCCFEHCSNPQRHQTILDTKAGQLKWWSQDKSQMYLQCMRRLDLMGNGRNSNSHAGMQ